MQTMNSRKIKPYNVDGDDIKQVSAQNGNLDSSESSGVPIDRGWAWMAVLGCFGIHVLVVGGIKTLGVLLVEIEDHFGDVSAKEMALVQGITYTLMMGLGLVTNMLSVRFTCRVVVFVGGLLTCVGFVLTAFVTRFWMVYLTYGVTVGLGFGLAYSPSLVFVGSHFKKHLSLSNGLSMSGSGIGSFALPNLMRMMLHEYGLPGCCLLMGAIMLNVCVCGLLFRPHSNYRKRPIAENRPRNLPNEESHSRTTDPTEALMDHEKLELAQGHSTTDAEPHRSKQNSTASSACQNDSKQGHMINKCIESDTYTVSEDQPLLHTSKDSSLASSYVVALKKDEHINVSKKALSSKPKQRIFEWSLLTDPVFFLLMIFTFLVGVAYPNIFFMLPVHAEEIGQDRDSAALLLSFIGISDLLGRLFIGWFTDFRLFESRYGLVASAFISGVLCLLIPYLTSFEGLAAYALLYGFFCGSYITLTPVVLSDTLGPEKLPSSYGMKAMALSATLIPAPLVCGQIRDDTGSWNYAFVFAGASVVFGSLFPLLQPCVQNKPGVRKTKVKQTSEI